ncbi:MAG: hypothetical protein GXP55_01675 [Deltaproteobacteria bacterium]|nr:hypothetical protein [Deltaproteobacteria bacterium]
MLNAHVEAQREVVEDSWAQAEAVMAADPVPRPRAPRRSIRAERRIALMQWLRWQAAEAHVIRPGDVRLQLRAPPHMSWVWFGSEDMPHLGWRLDGAQPLCGRSCEVSLPVGRVRLGLLPERGQIAMSEPFTVALPGRVRAHYVPRVTRVLSTIGLLLLSDVVGVGAAYGVFRGIKGWGGFLGAVALGVGIIVSAHVVGFVRLARSRPRVSLEFTPMVSSSR